jgi:hypothetical protein
MLGGARREKDVKKRKECGWRKFWKRISVSMTELSRRNDEATIDELPAANEQSEQVSACDASRCLQFSASL